MNAPNSKPITPGPEREPDDVIRIRLEEGYDVVAYSFGTGDEVLFCANGGPGLPCDYVRDSHSLMADRGFRVVAWDQLGCGRSDRPDDTSLWTLERYVAEAEQVRKALNLGKIHFLGQSWGTWMGTEYALTHQENLKSLILADGNCNIPRLVTDLLKMREALGSDTVAMMKRREADGTIDHPEYEAAITLLNYRHVCRLDEWPAALNRSLDDWNMGPYMAMQGPNEFTYTGNMKDWNRVPDMPKILVPTLLMSGLFDEVSPACIMEMHDALPNSEVRVFLESSHMPFFEEPEAYYECLEGFLRRASNA
ncbi:proline iminopeptidase-family hydrolase [Kordiimonas lacus]|uniref:Proline iminopeptidase n=1 Tax=Kordiimonas lacus TaxID=637679 RepID=A0A1G7EU87_9PROT|nr:proline iminopeptidase-family hydrolase [Kordiimonas lacus]SDE67209.1 proline iminopeptidase [Kordiimonas lacus]